MAPRTRILRFGTYAGYSKKDLRIRDMFHRERRVTRSNKFFVTTVKYSAVKGVLIIEFINASITLLMNSYGRLE